MGMMMMRKMRISTSHQNHHHNRIWIVKITILIVWWRNNGTEHKERLNDKNMKYPLTDSVPSSIVKECFSFAFLHLHHVSVSPPSSLLLLPLLSPPASLFHSSTFQKVFGSQGGIFWFCNCFLFDWDIFLVALSVLCIWPIHTIVWGPYPQGGLLYTYILGEHCVIIFAPWFGHTIHAWSIKVAIHTCSMGSGI